MKGQLLISCIIILVAQKVYAQPNIAWNQYYAPPGKGCSLVDYKMDSQGNLNLAIDIFDSATTYLTAAIIKYDPTGQIAWQWINPNPLNNQSKRLLLDQNDNVYLLTWDASYRNHVTKINGNSGSGMFDFSLDTSFYSAEILLDSNNVYVAQSAPDLLLTVLDLSGNLISTAPLDFIQRIYGMKKAGSDIVIIGDTIVNSMQWYLRAHHLTTGGIYIQKKSAAITAPYVTDIELVSDSAVYVTGNTTSYLPYLIKFNLFGSDWDTLISISGTSSNMGKLTEMNGQLYWSYVRSSGSGTFFYLNLANNMNVVNLAVYDSCRTVEFDMCTDSNNVTYSATAFRPSTLYYDYDINAFNPSTGLIWNFRYSLSSTSREIPQFIDESNGSLYVLGELYDNLPSGGSKVNILKLNSITDINLLTKPTVSIIIYPNPNEHRTFKLSKDLKNASIQVFDLNGKLIRLISGFNGQHLDLPEVNPGVYIVQISSDNWLKTQRIVLN